MASLKSRFSTPELLAGGGSLLVLAVVVVFGFGLNSFWPNDTVVAASGLLLLVIVGQRMGWIDFGASQRSLIVVLGFLMGLMLVDYLLVYIRGGFGGGGTFIIGLLLAWIGEGAAAAGAYLVLKAKRA